MFAKAGYTTFMTGKWHNGAESARRAFAEGKAVFFGGMGDPYKLPVQDFTAGGDLGDKRLSGKHSVELFADRRNEPPPAWTRDIGPVARPLYLVAAAESMKRLRRLCLAESPEPMRRRRLYAPPNFLEMA